MKTTKRYDAIIAGGSYSGLAAALALGRALKKVLVIDAGKPCNAQTPFSHNFLTQDGIAPTVIAATAKQQLQAYRNVSFRKGTVAEAEKTDTGFVVRTDDGGLFKAQKLIFATGIKDLFPDIEGFSECWGISALHCPYCHGFEARGKKTAILANGDAAFDFTRLISNWADDLVLYTNGPSTLAPAQLAQLRHHGIETVETEIEKLRHDTGRLVSVHFKNGSEAPHEVLYAPRPFEQHSTVPQQLGCAFTDEGYIKVDAFQETTVAGVFASGDNSSRMRTVANAVATGTTAGISASKKIIFEAFEQALKP